MRTPLFSVTYPAENCFILEYNSRVQINWKRNSDFGDLGIIEFNQLSFIPRRLYWINNFVPGAVRGNHAHKTLRQVLVVLNGNVKLELFRGESKRELILDSESAFLYVEPGTWRRFSSDDPRSVLLVICDKPFDESDYIRTWQTYIEWYKTNHAC